MSNSFSAFLWWGGRGSHNSLAVNRPVWRNLEVIQYPKYWNNGGSSRQGSALGTQAGTFIPIKKIVH